MAPIFIRLCMYTYLLDSALTCLMMTDPIKTFVSSEMYFVPLWWKAGIRVCVMYCHTSSRVCTCVNAQAGMIMDLIFSVIIV